MARVISEGSGKGVDQPQHILHAAENGTLTLPEGVQASVMEITREGQNLVMTAPDGEVYVVEGYFAAAEAPLILSANGAMLSPALIQSFLKTHGDVQLAANTQANDQSPVGEATEVSGKATVTHADGTKETIVAGTHIYEGDIIETDAHGAVNIKFADDSSFAVSQNARMAIDDFSFNSTDQSGTTGVSILRGVFMFTSGLIGRENPDAVHIETPVGSIGIRGTIIGGNISESGGSKITVIEGAIVIRNGSGELILSTQFETVQLTSYAQSIVNIGTLNAAQMTDTYGAVRSVAPALFTSIDDTKHDSSHNQPPVILEKPQTVTPETPQNTAPHTPAENPVTNPLNILIDRPVFQELTTGSHIASDLGAAPTSSGVQSPNPAPAPVNVAPPPLPDGPPVTIVPPAPPAAQPPSAPDLRNPAPLVFTLGGAVDENTPSGHIVGTVGQSSATGLSVTYSLISNPGNQFTINTQTGVVTLAQNAGDYDTGTTHYDLIVRATRTDNLQKFIDTPLSVTVNNVDEEPVFGQVGTHVDEGASVLLTHATVGAKDPEGDANLTYTVTATAKGVVQVYNGTAWVDVSNFTDAQMAANHVRYLHNGDEPESGAAFIKLTATDGTGHVSVEVTVPISVAPTNDAPTDINLTANHVNENASVSTLIGTVSTIDSDAGDTHTYSLINNGGGRFTINPNTGAITVLNSSLLDYESAQSHTIIVRTTDSGGTTFDKQFTIYIDDVNEAPTNITLASRNVDENAANGTVIGTAIGTDPDAGDTLTYTLADTIGGRFAIDPNTGIITVADGSKLDYETQTSYTITVRVTDSGGLTRDQAFTININDVNEAPNGLTLNNNTIPENVLAGTIVGKVTGTDPDSGQTLTYSLTNNPGNLFSIGATTGQIQLATGASLNYENAASHSITVRVTDQGGLHYDKVFTIDVVNVNEAPTAMTAAALAPLAEGTMTAAVAVATLNITDPDGVNAINDYHFTVYKAGTSTVDSRFSVINDGGVYKVVANPLASFDFETEPNISLKVVLIDGAFPSVVADNIPIIIANVNEPATTITINNGVEFVSGVQGLVQGRLAGATIGILTTNDPDTIASFRPTAANFSIIATTGSLAITDFMVVDILRDSGRIDQVLKLAPGVSRSFSGSEPLSVTIHLDANMNGIEDAGDFNRTLYLTGSNNSMILEFVDGKNGFQITNDSRFGGAGFGTAIAVGDYNADGRADIIVGAPTFKNGSATSAGGIYAFSGDAGFKADTLNDGNVNLRTITGIGTSPYSGAGDYNPANDAVVGFLKEGSASNGFYGGSIVSLRRFDSTAGADFAVSNPGAGTVEIIRNGNLASLAVITGVPTGTGADAIVLASLGDINGDGYTDLLIGAPNALSGFGEVGIVYGSLSPLNTRAYSGLTLLHPETVPSRFGAAIAGVGDIDGDGFNDFIVGAPTVDIDGTTTPAIDQGAVFAYFGSYAADFNVTKLQIRGTTNGQHLGAVLSGAGDFNGDGLSDILLRDDASDGGRGSLYLIYGNAALKQNAFNITDLNNVAGFNGISIHWSAADPSIKVGTSISRAGDFNGDGYDDIAIDVSKDLGGGHYQHTIYILYGSVTPNTTYNLDNLTDTQAFKIYMLNSTDSKITLTSAGDFNGDGYSDLIIGTPATHTGDTSTNADGSLTLVYGGNYDGKASAIPSDGYATTNGASYVGTTGNDVLRSNGHTNLSFRGGDGNDTVIINQTNAMRHLDGGAGNDTLKLFFSAAEEASVGAPNTINLQGLRNTTTGIETIEFEMGSKQDTLQLDIRDVISLLSTSANQSLTIKVGESLSGIDQNRLSLFLNGTQLSNINTLTANQNFTNNADHDSAKDTVTIDGNLYYSYTQVSTGAHLMVDARIAGADTLAGAGINA